MFYDYLAKSGSLLNSKKKKKGSITPFTRITGKNLSLGSVTESANFGVSTVS